MGPPALSAKPRCFKKEVARAPETAARNAATTSTNVRAGPHWTSCSTRGLVSRPGDNRNSGRSIRSEISSTRNSLSHARLVEEQKKDEPCRDAAVLRQGLQFQRADRSSMGITDFRISWAGSMGLRRRREADPAPSNAPPK